MRLDDLLSELQARLDAVLATRDRVHTLLEAVVLIGGDLELETVLRRIVETATRLVDAGYGALGVIGDDHSLVEFLPAGLSETETARIRDWPHEFGLLDQLIKEPKPLRLSRIADHPPMGSFLGVPLRVRDEIFGNLYLTEKRGGADFDEEDEAVVVALATAAGVAIENARMYEETRRRELWLQATAEVTTSLLSGDGPGDVLAKVAKRIKEMADSDTALVFFPVDGGTSLRALVAEGLGGLIGGEIGLDTSLAGHAYKTGESLIVNDMTAAGWETIGGLPIGPAAAIPLGNAGSVRGVLGLGKRPGRIPFTTSSLEMLKSFAAQATVALELAEARRDAERISLLEDRDRIAKDLHDVVIQRLFAVAMTLMSTVRLMEHPEAAARVRHSVDELDATIRQIRATIFALQGPLGPDESGLRARVAEIVDKSYGDLGFRPMLRLDGQLDYGVPEEIADHVLAVLREALSNVVRHAAAKRVEVSLEAGDEVTLTVDDDGVGLPPNGRRSGLRNLAERAENLGGCFEVARREGRGTHLQWRVPLS
ncbi:GAF domain-containing sensor histidine kinase [Herbidospora daliensis]|uniref:GAF domain-containing sensor histidine kinase n=1 Tax=Herbidospora daliensis TaxID=295585 RepID=UPI0022B68330|nr:GAF domain-containing protein [Herbidospora daliensis]